MREYELVALIAARLLESQEPTIEEETRAVLSARALLRLTWSMEIEHGRVTDGVRLINQKESAS